MARPREEGRGHIKPRLLIVGSGPWYHPIWMGLKQALAALEADNWPVKHMWTNHEPNDIARQFDRFKPEVVILCGCRRLGLLEPFKVALKQLSSSVPRGLWMNDLRPAKGRAEMIHGWFSHVFLCWSRSYQHKRVCQGRDFSHEQWGRIVKARVHFMPQGSATYDEPLDTIERWRCIFIGNLDHPAYHYGRRRMCHEMRAIALNGNTRTQRAEYEKAMSKLYRASRYCLSTSPLVPGYTSVRSHKILATGGLMLLHQFPDAGRLFRDGVHAIHFKDTRDGLLTMAQYDKQPELREQIRQAGWKLQRRKHTVEQRIRNMVANMLTLDQSFWGYLR